MLLSLPRRGSDPGAPLRHKSETTHLKPSFFFRQYIEYNLHCATSVEPLIIDEVDRSIISISRFRQTTSHEFLQVPANSFFHVLKAVAVEVARRANRSRPIRKTGVDCD
jgi:hypothetical protein